MCFKQSHSGVKKKTEQPIATVTVIILLFWGFLACSNLHCVLVSAQLTCQNWMKAFTVLVLTHPSFYSIEDLRVLPPPLD